MPMQHLVDALVVGRFVVGQRLDPASGQNALFPAAAATAV
jgi:hypothetical protein